MTGILAALMTGCSSQPLTGHMTGTGGIGTGGSATGGFAVGATGGTSGSAVAACQDLANQYQQALAFAQTCSAGADCSQVVNDALSVCGSCLTSVTNSSKLDVLQQRWDQENCLAILPRIPCPQVSCALPTGAVCATADGGTQGTCASVYGALVDGGSSSCSALVDKYAVALAAAKSCTIGAAGQCTQSAAPSLLPCRSECVEFVNDTTELDAIRQAWDQQGCSKTAGSACPDIPCSPAGGASCSATDASGPSCGAGVLVLL